MQSTLNSLQTSLKLGSVGSSIGTITSTGNMLLKYVHFLLLVNYQFSFCTNCLIKKKLKEGNIEKKQSFKCVKNLRTTLRYFIY